MFEAFTDPLIGKVVQERYRIERKLGQGGMGAVYLAEHVLLQKKVALKCLHAGLASDPEVVRRFHNEALAAAAIGHPNIVDVTDMGRFEDGSVYMVLEYLDGRDFEDDLERSGRQPIDKVVHIGLQLCDALSAAGAKGIIHRDLKPENIFLIERKGDPDFVKILDFGISKFKDGLSGATQTGQMMGTPYYMAPEQARGASDITHLVDVYAIGVIFHRALTGYLPFDAGSLPELVLKIATEAPASVARRTPSLPPRLVALVDSMLEKDPHRRPPTFDHVAEVLFEFAPDAPRPPRRPPALIIATQYTGSSSEEPLGGPKALRPPVPREESLALDTRIEGTPDPLTEPLSEPRSSPQAVSAPEITQLSAGRGPSRLLPAAMALVTGLALLTGFLIFRRAGDEVPVAPHPVGPQAPMARIQISTIPPDAELTLDGVPLTNPFDGPFERDTKKRTLRATRDGFTPTERTLVPTTSQQIFIQLTPEERAGESDVLPVAPQPTLRAVVSPRGPAKQEVAETAPQVSPAPPPAEPIAPPSPASTPKEPSPLKKVF